jgi:hypothetical protein
MIIQSIHNSWDMVYNQYRNTVYKTLEDPISQKKVVEVVQFLYTKNGNIEAPEKGRNVDKQA